MKLVSKWTLAAGLLLLLTVWVGWEVRKALRAFEEIPPRFGLTLPYSEGACESLLSYTGGVAIGLDEETLRKIENQGLSFFDDMEPMWRIHFSEWRETPVPETYWREGGPVDLACARQHAWFWPSELEDALKRPGSYYSESGHRNAYVIPALRLIVVTPNTR